MDELFGRENLMGSGVIFLSELDEDGLPTGGELDIGDCSVFEFETSADQVVHKESRTRRRVVTASAITGAQISINITGSTFNAANLARALYGTAGSLAQTAGTATDEAIADVKQGMWYPLLNRAVSNVVVELSGGTPEYDLTNDYLIDADSGRIYIVVGGAIADDSDIQVSYSFATIALPSVSGMSDGSLKRYLRFKGDPPSGPIWEVEIWRVNLMSSGSIGFISDGFGNWQLKGTIEADTINHPDCPHYRKVQLGYV